MVVLHFTTDCSNSSLIAYVTVILTVVEYIILMFPLTFILIYCEFSVENLHEYSPW